MSGGRWPPLIMRAWSWLRLTVGIVLFGTGLWLTLPLLTPMLVQDSAPGRLVQVYGEHDAAGDLRLRVLFEYSTEDETAKTIHLGSRLAGSSGEILDPPLISSEQEGRILADIAAAGGPEELPCRVFVGGGEPRVHCPMLVGDPRRWQHGVICLAIPVILMLSSFLHSGLTNRLRAEPLAASCVDMKRGAV